jgi:hypothetical protein
MKSRNAADYKEKGTMMSSNKEITYTATRDTPRFNNLIK